jgi:hypothetical protein
MVRVRTKNMNLPYVKKQSTSSPNKKGVHQHLVQNAKKMCLVVICKKYCKTEFFI